MSEDPTEQVLKNILDDIINTSDGDLEKIFERSRQRYEKFCKKRENAKDE